MSDIVVSRTDAQKDLDLAELIKILPIECLNPLSPNFNINNKFDILHKKYYDKLLKDGLMTGHILLNPSDNQYYFNSHQGVHTIAGFMFEAYIVRKINENKKSIGKRILAICSNRKVMPQDNTIERLTAIGTGFLATKNRFPGFYIRSFNSDILFLEPKDSISRYGEQQTFYQPVTIRDTRIYAGLQVKAITAHEKEEIIQPLINGEYQYVLTLLRHSPEHMPSYVCCLNILQKMEQNGEIDTITRRNVTDRIISPEHVGLDQNEIDEYYNYIIAWFSRQVPATPDIIDGIGLEIEASTDYQGGIVIER